MKKWLIFGGGVLTGVVLTFVFAIIFSASRSGGSDGTTWFEKPGDVIDVKADTKKDNNGKDRDIAKVTMQRRHSVRDDLLRYLQSNIQTEGDKAV